MIRDISPPIDASLAVWPGDTHPGREILLDRRAGSNITLSTLHATVHLGAHVDGPNHYGDDVGGVDTLPLDLFVGRCQVIGVEVERGTRVRPADLATTIDAERVLIRTGTYPDRTRFLEDFAGLSPELIDALAGAGVRLVGIDTPSVDLFASKDLPAHQACLRRGMTILEGVVLTDVPPGFYELIALPLRLVGFDASPVRAILRTL